MLSVRAVSKTYGANQVLSDVNLDVPRGTVHAVLGANGAGKSTLMKCVAGAVVPDAGTITVDGVSRTALNPLSAQRLGVAVVYQHLSLIGSLSVAENIFLGVERQRLGLVDGRAQRREAAAVLARLGQDINPATRVEDLPADARQMVEIAKAVVKSPKVLILDEPTAALSDSETQRLFAMIRQLKRSDIAIIYISHRIPEVFEIADDVTVMRDGRVAMQSKTGDTTMAAIIAAMLGDKSAIGGRSAPAARSDEVVLEAKSLTAGALWPVSFSLRRGEILGVYGLTGSGRETLAAAVSGAARSSGSLVLEGSPVVFRRPGDAIARGVCLVPGDRLLRGLFGGMTTIDNMLVPSMRRLGGLLRSRGSELGLFTRAAENLGLTPPGPNYEIGQLSGGNQQKILLGRWIAQPEKLKVLVLEEPTEGVDAGARRELYAKLARAIADYDLSILWSSSDIDELVEMVDRVLVMAGGRVVGELVGSAITAGAILNLAQAVPELEAS